MTIFSGELPPKWLPFEEASCRRLQKTEDEQMHLQRSACHAPGSLRSDTSHKLYTCLPVFFQ